MSKNLKDALKEYPQLIRGPKGALTNASTLDANLDYFYGASRNTEESIINHLFDLAMEEDRECALASLLCNLDVRNGKGERRLFKVTFSHLCRNHPEDAALIMNFVPELGRWDYILEALDTPAESKAIEIIAKQLAEDLESEYPSLLAKWLPSHRTHGKRNPRAKKLMRLLNMNEKDYRKILSTLRKRLEITERAMSEGNWEGIQFGKVPSKAMLKYESAFLNHCREKYIQWFDDVKAGKDKINTNGLLCYEIVRKFLNDPENLRIFRWNSFYDSKPKEFPKKDGISVEDLMWEAQEDFLAGNNDNLLIIADTSGSMTEPSMLPLGASLGLALYTAERNHGIFHNCFITFSEDPIFQEIKGESLRQKLAGIKMINESTNIDNVFDLILSAATENAIVPEDMPTKLLILSDMEFDIGIDSCKGTNFNGWKLKYERAGYPFPQIIFWNLGQQTHGAPATKKDNDVIMVSGFSPVFLRDVLPLEDITPSSALRAILSRYTQMIRTVEDNKS